MVGGDSATLVRNAQVRLANATQLLEQGEIEGAMPMILTAQVEALVALAGMGAAALVPPTASSGQRQLGRGHVDLMRDAIQGAVATMPQGSPGRSRLVDAWGEVVKRLAADGYNVGDLNA